MYDEEFLDGLTEEPQSFEIVPEEESFQVDAIDAVQQMSSKDLIITHIYKSLFTLDNIWYAFKSTSSVTSYEFSRLRQILNSELEFMLAYNDIEVESELDSIILLALDTVKESAVQDIQTVIMEYTTILELYSCNFPPAEQQLINDWVLTLRYNL